MMDKGGKRMSVTKDETKDVKTDARLVYVLVLGMIEQYWVEGGQGHTLVQRRSRGCSPAVQSQ